MYYVVDGVSYVGSGPITHICIISNTRLGRTKPLLT